jgi:hypothetical protein
MGRVVWRSPQGALRFIPDGLYPVHACLCACVCACVRVYVHVGGCSIYVKVFEDSLIFEPVKASACKGGAGTNDCSYTSPNTVWKCVAARAPGTHSQGHPQAHAPTLTRTSVRARLPSPVRAWKPPPRRAPMRARATAFSVAFTEQTWTSPSGLSLHGILMENITLPAGDPAIFNMLYSHGACCSGGGGRGEELFRCFPRPAQLAILVGRCVPLVRGIAAFFCGFRAGCGVSPRISVHALLPCMFHLGVCGSAPALRCSRMAQFCCASLRGLGWMIG